jgi:hypothetical protein
LRDVLGLVVYPIPSLLCWVNLHLSNQSFTILWPVLVNSSSSSMIFLVKFLCGLFSDWTVTIDRCWNTIWSFFSQNQFMWKEMVITN